jgi:hypothetical protein
MTEPRRLGAARWNPGAVARFVSMELEVSVMLVERTVPAVDIDLVGEAYDIAANYLKRTGAMAETGLINDVLLQIISALFQAGEHNRLRLANLAITRFLRVA